MVCEFWEFGMKVLFEPIKKFCTLNELELVASNVARPTTLKLKPDRGNCDIKVLPAAPPLSTVSCDDNAVPKVLGFTKMVPAPPKFAPGPPNAVSVPEKV